MFLPSTYHRLWDRLVFAFDQRNPRDSGMLKHIHEASGLFTGAFLLGFILWITTIGLICVAQLIASYLPLMATHLYAAAFVMACIHLLSMAVMFTMVIVLSFIVPYHFFHALPSSDDVTTYKVY